MRSVTALVAVMALVAAPIGMFIPPPESTPSRIVVARWGEFDHPRSSTFDPLSDVTCHDRAHVATLTPSAYSRPAMLNEPACGKRLDCRDECFPGQLR